MGEKNKILDDGDVFRKNFVDGPGDVYILRNHHKKFPIIENSLKILIDERYIKGQFNESCITVLPQGEKSFLKPFFFIIQSTKATVPCYVGKDDK